MRTLTNQSRYYSLRSIHENFVSLIKNHKEAADTFFYDPWQDSGRRKQACMKVQEVESRATFICSDYLLKVVVYIYVLLQDSKD